MVPACVAAAARGEILYRVRGSAPLYEAINRRSRRLFRLMPQVFDPHGDQAMRAATVDGIFRTSVDALARDASLFQDLSRMRRHYWQHAIFNERFVSDSIYDTSGLHRDGRLQS